ncbi:hypothetical protein [Komagataeibacter oboediens]|nr:hypothetical protein [Komagataeibacter oboediens]
MSQESFEIWALAAPVRSEMTPIGARLVVMLSDERQRMANEWFCKWHYISGSMPVEIESFNGRPIRYGGIRYTGVPQTIYRQTIQHYLAKKICEVFYGIEDEILRYPFAIRVQALSEAKSFITDFAQQIRHEAVEKDRILQGDGFKFPQRQDNRGVGWFPATGYRCTG